MIGVPLVCGFTSTTASSASYQVSPTGVAIPPGAVIVVIAGAAGATAATGASDTQGNAYALAASSTASEYLQVFTATAAAGLNPANGDAVTVTFAAANAQNKNLIVLAVTGTAALDIAGASNGSSAAPSATGTAASGNEIALAVCQCAAAGGFPAFGPSFAYLTGLDPSGQQGTAVGYAPVTRLGSLTASASVTSSAWAMILLTLTAAPPASLGSAASPEGGAQLPPFPVLPAPRTWAPGDELLTPRLRADPGNALLLLASPPLFVGSQSFTGQALPNNTITPVQIDTEATDTWQSHLQPAAAISPPLAGWYLAEGNASIGDNAAGTYAEVGIQAVQGGTASSSGGGRVAPNGSSNPLPTCADLVQVNPATADTIALYAFQDSGSGKAISSAWLKSEWVCAPSGTVITSPVPAAGWTSGATTLLAPLAAGAVTAILADPDGVVTGGTLVLDTGNPVAEAVTVTSLNGQTAGISACSWPHPASAPVGVPVSAAFMNQQVRDKIEFLAYRPAARLSNLNASAQNLPSQSWPAGTALQLATGARCFDNFSGWSLSSPTRYTLPVSGVYYLYGQVYVTDAASPFCVSAGLAVSGGTIMWGDRTYTAGNSQMACATVRRAAVRVFAGQYAEVYGSQGSGSARALLGTGNTLCKLIAVWRGF